MIGKVAMIICLIRAEAGMNVYILVASSVFRVNYPRTQFDHPPIIEPKQGSCSCTSTSALSLWVTVNKPTFISFAYNEVRLLLPTTKGRTIDKLQSCSASLPKIAAGGGWLSFLKITLNDSCQGAMCADCPGVTIRSPTTCLYTAT